MISNSTIQAFAEIGVDLEPRGIWAYPDGFYKKKQQIEMKGRMAGSKWSKYPNDNMGGFYLRKEHKLIVIDIDGCIVEQTPTGLFLPEVNFNLPNTFHTITSNKSKQHHYYSITDEQQLLLKGRNTTLPADIDVFTYASIFEGHPSDYHEVILNELVPLPQQLLEQIQVYQTTSTHKTGEGVTVTSHPQRYNLVKDYLADNLTTDKSRNQFYRMLLGKTDKKTNKIVPKLHYKMSYTLINDLAVRLTSTAELSHYDHTIPCIHKILTEMDIPVDSAKTNSILNAQILRTLPVHESITRNSILEELDISMLVAQQSDSSRPFIVKIPHQSKVAFIDIDRYTLEPITHGHSAIMQKDLAMAMHPERMQYSEDGRAVGWDDNVPMFYVIDNPYKPQYQLDPDTYQHTVNLFVPTQYQKEARMSEHIPQDNIVLKLMASTIHPSYLDLMMLWHAHLVFGSQQLNIVPWIASPKQTLGGTGKTQVTGTILTRLIGKAIIKIDEATFQKSWADIGEGVRSMSLQDFGALQNYKAFEPTYTKIKQVTDPMFSKMDAKHSTISTGKQTYQLSGTSNLRLPLPESDRRILALEPAFLDGTTKPLNAYDAKKIDKMVKDTTGDIFPEFQDYMDHLMYLYNQPLSEEDYSALFMYTPETIYRGKWVSNGLKKGERLYPSMTNAHELLNISKLDINLDQEHYIQLLQFIVHVYCDKTQKVGIPYNWFKEMIPYVIADQAETHLYSVADIGSIIGQEFKTNVGTLYTDKWRKNMPSYLPLEWDNWAAQGLVMRLHPEAIETYREVIADLQKER